MGLLCEVEGEHLDGEGGVPDEEDDAGWDDEDEDEDCVGEPLLLICWADLIIHNHADPLPEAFQNWSDCGLSNPQLETVQNVTSGPPCIGKLRDSIDTPLVCQEHDFDLEEKGFLSSFFFTLNY